MKCYKCGKKLRMFNLKCFNCGYDNSEYVTPIKNNHNNPEDILAKFDEELKKSQIKPEDIPQGAYIKKRTTPQKKSLSLKIYDAYLDYGTKKIPKENYGIYAQKTAKISMGFAIASIVLGIGIYSCIIGLIFAVVAKDLAIKTEKYYIADILTEHKNCKPQKIVSKIGFYISLYNCAMTIANLIIRALT